MTNGGGGGTGGGRGGSEEARGGFVLKSRSDEAPVRRRKDCQTKKLRKVPFFQ